MRTSLATTRRTRPSCRRGLLSSDVLTIQLYASGPAGRRARVPQLRRLRANPGRTGQDEFHVAVLLVSPALALIAVLEVVRRELAVDRAEALQPRGAGGIRPCVVVHHRAEDRDGPVATDGDLHDPALRAPVDVGRSPDVPEARRPPRRIRPRLDPGVVGVAVDPSDHIREA